MRIKIRRIVQVVAGLIVCVSVALAQEPMQAVSDSDRARSESKSAGPGLASHSATPAEFEIGAGDVVHVTVWREPDLTQTSVVRPDGRISMPLIGEVDVAGKTAVASQELITSLLLKYVTNPQVTVSVVEIHSRQVFITGQIQRPGAYPLIGSYSVLQLIASAGGLTPYAHKKRIVILDSTNRQVAQFDYPNALKGKSSAYRDLQPGDTVVVP